MANELGLWLGDQPFLRYISVNRTLQGPRLSGNALNENGFFGVFGRAPTLKPRCCDSDPPKD
jgi:hypothetical protein